MIEIAQLDQLINWLHFTSGNFYICLDLLAIAAVT